MSVSVSVSLSVSLSLSVSVCLCLSVSVCLFVFSVHVPYKRTVRPSKRLSLLRARSVSKAHPEAF